MKDFPRIPRSFALLRLETDGGVVGYGETSSSYGHSYPNVVREIVEGILAKALIGRDPTDIAGLVKGMRRYVWPYLGWEGVGNSAIGAAEIALYDILGKVEGRPLYQLLGATRDRIPLYGTGTTFFEQPPEWHAAFFDGALEHGFTAVKARVGRDRDWDLDLVRTVRHHIGPDVKLMVDAYMTYGRDTALAMAEEFEQYDIHFLEEPVSQYRLDVLQELRADCRIPIAVGERVFSPFGFERIIAHQAADILQPDVTIVGGVESFAVVCELARESGVRVCPHIGGLTAVGIAAGLHTALAHGNCEMLEFDLGPYQPLRDDMIAQRVFALTAIEDGELKAPDGPGLGIEVNEEKFATYAYQPGAVYPDVYPHYGAGEL
jgi:L-alanine-DL-glutamate epimerase-like enolase superfamily enzyme